MTYQVDSLMQRQICDMQKWFRFIMIVADGECNQGIRVIVADLKLSRVYALREDLRQGDTGLAKTKT